MTKGVLWVRSRVVESERLSDDKFCEWYENTHIQEVLSLSGVPSAARYSSLRPESEPKTSNYAPWLTLYEMPDIEFKNSAEFKGLAGQSPPTKELIEGIFKGARFDTRFYREVQCVEGSSGKKGPAKFVISAALEPPEAKVTDFDAWYREEHIAVLSRAPGFVRTRRYELVNGSTLERYERTIKDDMPKFLALHEFECEDLPSKELAESAQTEWSKRVMGDLVREEVGLFVLKREYSESEWGNVGQSTS